MSYKVQITPSGGWLIPVRQETYSILHMEAATCAWEHLIEKQQLAGEDWQGGAWNARWNAIAIAPIIVAIDKAAERIRADYHEGAAYDWEVIPFIVDLFQWTYDRGQRGDVLGLPMSIEDAATLCVDEFSMEE